jgi:hypothetical protein
MKQAREREGRIDEEGGLLLPARRLPPPRSISTSAQDYLRSQPAARRNYPAPSDIPAWRRLIDSYNAGFLEIMRPKLRSVAATVTRTELNGVCVYVGHPTAGGAQPGWTNLSLHGGALVFAGGELVETDAAMAISPQP